MDSLSPTPVMTLSKDMENVLSLLQRIKGNIASEESKNEELIEMSDGIESIVTKYADISTSTFSSLADSVTSSDKLSDKEFDNLLDVIEVQNNIDKYPNACQAAEWHLPKIILTHEPGIELYFGVFHPSAALFESTFDVSKCIKQHASMISQFESLGCQVLKVTQVLQQTANIDKLREFALANSITYDLSSVTQSISDEKEQEMEIKEQKLYMEQVIKQLDSDALTKMIILRPTILLSRDNKNTYFLADYNVNPLMNLLFLRDQLITTQNGVIIGSMNSKQRKYETTLIQFIVEQLGFKILLNLSQIEANMTDKNQKAPKLEGGDFIPAGKHVFIGQGLRTNEVAIKLCLENLVFGSEYVVVVKDSWKDQQEMHLDTYFNIINPQLAVLSEWRKNGSKNGSTIDTVVDVYQYDKNNKKYNKIIENNKFYDYLTQNLGFKIVLVSEKDQANYAINFLTVSPNKIIGVKGASAEYIKILKNNGVDATLLDLSHLTCAYGAVHCTTQPIVREKDQKGAQ